MSIYIYYIFIIYVLLFISSFIMSIYIYYIFINCIPHLDVALDES